MTWIVIAAEALIVAYIVARMVMKFRAMGSNEEEEELSQDKTAQPDLELPEEEKWE